MVDEIYDALSEAGIYLEIWHAESSSGQYEFVLPTLPPLEAVDTLLHAREIICTVASSYSMRATLHPKPFPAPGRHRDPCAHLDLFSEWREDGGYTNHFMQGS